MLPTLDARLTAAAELVLPGKPVADIGCDHGKLTAVLAADRPVQAAGRWYAVMAAEYTGEVRTPTFTECLFGRTAEWPEGAGYAAWQKAKLPRFRLGVPDGTELAEEIDKLLDGSPSQTR